jgi:hypothetical protein
MHAILPNRLEQRLLKRVVWSWYAEEPVRFREIDTVFAVENRPLTLTRATADDRQEETNQPSYLATKITIVNINRYRLAGLPAASKRCYGFTSRF